MDKKAFELTEKDIIPLHSSSVYCIVLYYTVLYCTVLTMQMARSRLFFMISLLSFMVLGLVCCPPSSPSRCRKLLISPPRGCGATIGCSGSNSPLALCLQI